MGIREGVGPASCRQRNAKSLPTSVGEEREMTFIPFNNMEVLLCARLCFRYWDSAVSSPHVFVELPSDGDRCTAHRKHSK